MQKVATRQPCGAVSLRYDAAHNETSQHGRREVCTPSSTKPLVTVIIIFKLKLKRLLVTFFIVFKGSG